MCDAVPCRIVSIKLRRLRLKKLLVFSLVFILICSLGFTSCRLAYRMGQASTADPAESNTQQQVPGPPAPSNPQNGGFPVIERFGATEGFAGKYGLYWVVTNATSVTLSPGIGQVALAENRTISPTKTTTYILTATNAAGTRSKAVTVTVAP